MDGALYSHYFIEIFTSVKETVRIKNSEVSPKCQFYFEMLLN